MSEFVYLFRFAPPSFSPQEMHRQMQRWTAWMKDLGEKGHIKNPGLPLDPRCGKVVSKQGTVTDGPYTEATHIVGGYMVVEAKDIEHAVTLSSGCPIIEGGGLVEVRPIMKL